MKKLMDGRSFLFLTAGLLVFSFAGLGQTVPGDARSAGLSYVVPDMACWFNAAGNYLTNGFINLNEAANPADLGNWEPFVSSMGENTFLIEFNTYANDGTLANQDYAVAIQPADGRKGKLVYAFYDDNGRPFPGMINLSRQNGNPGRVAGDRRVGGTNYITEAEVSFGQLPLFRIAQGDARWTVNPNNNIYQGTNRYAGEQVFAYNPGTMAVTPLTLAWDFVYGPVNLPMGPVDNAPQCSRVGGRPDFLDNGNIVVMIDDKTGIVDPVNGEVVTFAIITPTGQTITGYTEADNHDIYDNMCPFQGGFCIRDHFDMLFYNDSGVLQHSNNLIVAQNNLQAAPPAGWGLIGPGADAYLDIGRGDATRVAGDPRIPYVFNAEVVTWGGLSSSAQSNAVMLSIWDSRNGNFVTNVMVNPDLDHSRFLGDRAALGVNMYTQIVAATDAQLDKTVGSGWANQTIAQVMQFDGQNIHYLTPSFFAFINSDNANTLYPGRPTPQGFTTMNPSVAVTADDFCISAKGAINSTNNPLTAPDSPTGNTIVYTVISLPVPPECVVEAGNSVGSSSVTVPILLVAGGVENAVGFTLDFDPTRLTFSSIVPGSGAANAALAVNTGQVSNGFLGVSVALPTNAVFAAGTLEVAEVTFTAAAVTNAISTAVGFGNQVTETQVVDAQGKPLVTGFASGLVTITPAPIIMAAPQTQTAESGSSPAFYVVAEGRSPLSYQWFFQATNAVSGATNSFLLLPSVQPANSGSSYSVVITNRYGAATSDTATINVIPPVPRRTVSMLHLTGDAGSFLHLIDTEALGAGASWQALDAVTLTNSPQLYFDLTDPVPPSRFYRAWQTNVPSMRPAVDARMATEVTVAGTPGSRVRIDYINQFGPTNAWVTLDTVTMTNTTQPYFDLNMFHLPDRLYRLVPVPQ